MNVKFELGQLLITPGAAESLLDRDVAIGLRRHANCDWGVVCEEDAHQNNWALENEARLLSCYESEGEIRFWIITEADRSATTVLLPEEY